MHASVHLVLPFVRTNVYGGAVNAVRRCDHASGGEGVLPSRQGLSRDGVAQATTVRPFFNYRIDKLFLGSCRLSVMSLAPLHHAAALLQLDDMIRIQLRGGLIRA